MNIKGNYNTHYPPLNNITAVKKHVSDKKVEQKNYDSVTIQSTSREVEEKLFLATVTKDLKDQINHTESEKKIKSLKMQIETGNYKINTEELATKMLSFGKESTHE